MPDLTRDQLKELIIETISSCYDGICSDSECGCNQIMAAPPHLARKLKCEKNTTIIEQIAERIKKDKFGTV